ncbi:MAG: AarF/UbiB family protein [Chthoniobacteraceae bacterium]
MNRLRQTSPRLTQIVRVVVRHKFIGVLRGKGHWPSPQEVRKTFEELGLVFIKFGQILALRRDLLPDAYITELEQLQDQLPTVAFAEIRETVETELGASLEQLFASFSETPLAAATIAQVHVATMQDGRPVVVKVQRPGLRAQISTDIAALAYLAALGERLSPRLRTLGPARMVQEFAESLRQEIDFGREARSIRRFRTSMAEIENLWIPDFIGERSSTRVLTMDHSYGERLDRYVSTHPESKSGCIDTFVKVMLRSIFEVGFFHADPHPGNLFVLPDGRVCLHDFGNMGELDETMRDSLSRMLAASVGGDARAATDGYLEIAKAGDDLDRPALQADIAAILRDMKARAEAQISIGDALTSLLRAGSRHGVRSPRDFFLLTRAFVITESLLSQLDPQFNFTKALREEMIRANEQRRTPARLLKTWSKVFQDVERLANDAPIDTHRILRRIAEGDLGRLRVPEMEHKIRNISRDLERLTGGVVVAALIIGGSMLEMVSRGGWLGFIGRAMLSIGLIGALIIAIGAWLRFRRNP